MVKALPEISISVLRPSSTQWPASCTLCQTTSKTGTQPHPLAERLPKIIIRSQTPQNTPPKMILPTRKTRSKLIHQNTGTNPLHQEAYTTQWINPTHWGQTPKTMGTTNLQPVKRRPQHSKLSKMSRQRNIRQMKEQGKNPPDQKMKRKQAVYLKKNSE